MTSTSETNRKTKAAAWPSGPSLGPSSALTSSEENDLMGRGFALAYFLLADRTAAIATLIGALNKVKARVDREHKRAYWRDKFLKRQITRVTREDDDALQWLICFESDYSEREQEANGQVGADDMLVRYIKTLVRISTAMSSFYVNVAIHRLLHCYTTSEAQEIYEMVAESYRGADAYRRAKRLLMLKLESRFTSRIQKVKIDHGEARYELIDDPERFCALSFQCLRLLTPWSTQDKCPTKNYSGTSSYQLHEAFRRDFDSNNDKDKIEIGRCHAFIDPECLEHLAKALGLERHSSKLGIPRFYMDFDHNVRPPSSRLPEIPLTGQERSSIKDALDEEEGRRKRVVARVIAFVVDGTEHARVDIERKRDLQFDVPFGARLIEVRTEDQKGPLVLATHLLEHRESQGQHPEFTLSLRGDRSISIATMCRRGKEADSYTISISVRATKQKTPSLRIWQWHGHARAIPAYTGLLLMLLAIGLFWFGYRRGPGNERAPLDQPKLKVTQEHEARSAVSGRVAATAPSYRLMPDDLLTRSSSQVGDNAIVVPRTPALINLELPVTAPKMRYRVALIGVDSNEAIIAETDLIPVTRASAFVLAFSLPSTMLEPSRYYRIELREVAHSDRLRTFTFYTEPKQP